MRLVFFGSGEFAVPSLRKLTDLPHEIAAVITQPDRPAGRGKRAAGTPVAEWAGKLQLPLERCPDVNDPAFVERMAALRADLGIVIAFGQKLREPLRRVFRHECVNLHGSLLPRHRGASPIAHAILSGDRRTGVTVFRLVDRMDAGPILLTRQTIIGDEETCGELHDRLSGVGCDAIDATLKAFAEAAPGEPRFEPQDESAATTAPKLSKLDGHLQFEEPAERLALRCRALYPWPGARCRYMAADGKSLELTLAVATAAPRPAEEPPGTLTAVMTVATGSGTLEPHSVQPAGGRLMSWRDFVNGRRVRPGDRLASLDAPG